MISARRCGISTRDRRSYISWCLKQSRGVRIIDPSVNLARAYTAKARTALKAVEVNSDAGLMDWAVSASYYAKYFSVYSILMRLGLQCEIHDCTIALFVYLFEGEAPEWMAKELQESKQNRIEMQYYTGRTEVSPEEILHQSRDFVIEAEKLADGLTSEKVREFRRRIQSASKGVP